MKDATIDAVFGAVNTALHTVCHQDIHCTSIITLPGKLIRNYFPSGSLFISAVRRGCVYTDLDGISYIKELFPSAGNPTDYTDLRVNDNIRVRLMHLLT